MIVNDHSDGMALIKSVQGFLFIYKAIVAQTVNIVLKHSVHTEVPCLEWRKISDHPANNFYHPLDDGMLSA